MPAERLLASYIVRVLVQGGKRSITLHDVRSGETQTFGSYGALLEQLNELEKAQERTPEELPLDA